MRPSQIAAIRHHNLQRELDDLTAYYRRDPEDEKVCECGHASHEHMFGGDDCGECACQRFRERRAA